jgi:nucleoside-diphosphate-sugar epimerase
MTDRTGRTRVLLTGATGNWGTATLREFRDRGDRIDVLVLARPTRRDRSVLREFADMENLEVVWGDLTDYTAVEECVRRVDIVLHLGAVVSPLADQNPELTRRVNIGSLRNIIRAVKGLPDPGSVAVVGIGSVAETGDRNPPRHWGRVGDPLRVSRFDDYGQTKIVAEKDLVESGLPRWVWLRQSGIFHRSLLEVRDPIMTHPPLGGVLEWASAEDSARLLANICDGVPDEFWREIYNVGGGESWRITNWQLLTMLSTAMGVKDARRWYDRNWFALKNFHGHWYTDSDRLEALVPFRGDSFEDAVARAIAAAPASVRSAGKVPAWVVKNLALKPLALKPRGTLGAIRANRSAEIAAHFGSRQDWEAIGDWSTFEAPAPGTKPTYLDHGYDESKPRADWSADVYTKVATFRGGELRSTEVATGDLDTALDWRCAFGHEFTGSPRLILVGGHWCPECVVDTAGYARQAEHNPFLAQLELAHAR